MSFLILMVVSYVYADDTSLNEESLMSDALSGDLVDYPTYKQIPKTSFSCKGKLNWHYYADPEAQCQVFHVCETDFSKISFLCPEGSIFNQRHLVCDWWYNFDCNDATGFYALNDDYYDSKLSEFEALEDRMGFDLNPASSGGNRNPKKT